MEVEREIIKYSKLNNVFLLVKRQDLRDVLNPNFYRIACTMLLFRNTVVPVFRYFFAT